MKRILVLSLISMMLSGLTACESGPFEKWGKKADEAAQDVSDKVNNRGPAEKAGNRIDKKINKH